MLRTFKNRTEAGRLLAAQVGQLPFKNGAPVVVALPRGGLPVALEVALALHAPLTLVLVRKIGAPLQSELAIGAVVDGEHADVVIDHALAARTGADDDYIEAAVRDGLREIARRHNVYFRGRTPLTVQGREVVVVDDGIATGSTMKAALRALRRQQPARLVLAVPVAAGSALRELASLVDDVVCLAQPEFFGAVAQYYASFPQLSDDDVLAALHAADDAMAAGGASIATADRLP